MAFKLSRPVKMGAQITVLSLLGVAALVSAADRLAAVGVELSPVLPLDGPFRLENAARKALAAGDIELAKALAKRAILAGPVEASTSSLLGIVALQSGDVTLTQSAFRVGGQLGWRDTPVQAWIATQAQAVGDPRVMAERIDAALRIGTPYDSMSPALNALEGMPGGADALAVRLGHSPSWREQYLGSLNLLADADIERRARIEKLARLKGLPLDCNSIGISTFKLSQMRRARIALALWQMLECGPREPRNLTAAAGGFDESDVSNNAATPFRWVVTTDADGEAMLDVSPVSSGQALFVRGTGAKLVRVARRMIILSPGRYMLRWKAVDSAHRPSDAVEASLVCSVSYAPLGPLNGERRQKGTRFTAAFDVPAKDCDAQLVLVNIQRVDAAKDGAWIDDIEIVSAG